ncbi:hypothetical protein OJF2_51850 [Aquisphaera giovannonii]|uniref:Uncharacterized protein n=1 Tax=Aquisphaera giovannonii TaxID=406548 RepID=A0A5B9W965_9BACT|nr:hypothetical protein [Aquisphaera giovannonii]QEH36601.1 hypothetical protein OJF2_51850 [Aquisphaera giovannonii]
MPSDQDRLRDVFKSIDQIKATEYPTIVGSEKGYRIVERPWKDMPEPSKLALLQDQVDWSGVSNRDRATILLGQIDVGKITDVQRNRLIDAATREEPVAGEKPLSAAQVKALGAEIRADEHAARVRDFGEADAATYDARMAEANRLRSEEHGPVQPPSPPITEAELQGVERGWSKLGDQTANFAVAKERDSGNAEVSRIQNGPPEPAPSPQLESVMQEIGWLQSMSYLREEGQVPQAASDTTLPWWEDLSRSEQAAVLQANVNWDGFTEAQKEALIDVVLEGESASFFESVVDRPIRPLTKELIECCKLDVWPGMATVVDFGIDSSSHLGALQFAIREQLVTPQELDAAMGNGAKLTEIAQRGENPYRDVTFRTSWDLMLPEPEEPPPQGKPGVTQDFGEILRAARLTPADTRSDFQRMLDEAGMGMKTPARDKERDRGGPER